MLTFNTAAAFKTPYQVNCKKAMTNPTMNKNIRFGEDDGGDSYKPSNRDEEIQQKYENEKSKLIGKSNYWERVEQLEHNEAIDRWINKSQEEQNYSRGYDD